MKKITALFLALALCLSLCTVAFADVTYYAITNGTPESAKETNHGYIAIDKATAAKDETVTITVNPATGYQFKSLTATPVAPTISTIADVLATIEGFPASEVQTKIPANAWVADVQNSQKCYAYTVTSGSTTGLLLAISADGETRGDFTPASTATEVTPGENCYTAPFILGTLTFNMTDGVLTGFTCTHNEGKVEKFDGTYTPASSPTARLKPITPAKQTDGTYTFTMPDYAVTVTAEFEAIHTHTYAETWSTDATNHWHAATCEHTSEKADVAAHADNNKDHKCDVCGYVMSQCVDSNHDNKCDVCDKNMGGGTHHGGSTTPVVTAPKTADAGIALYGVLTVSSLLGMGWVSKKKR